MKETLDIIFQVTQFYEYLFRMKFALETSYEPVTEKLYSKESILPLETSRIHKSVLILGAPLWYPVQTFQEG